MLNVSLIIPLLLDMDFDVDPAPAVDEATFPAAGAQTALEVTIDQEVVAPAPTVIILPSPSSSCHLGSEKY